MTLYEKDVTAGKRNLYKFQTNLLANLVDNLLEQICKELSHDLARTGFLPSKFTLLTWKLLHDGHRLSRGQADPVHGRCGVVGGLAEPGRGLVVGVADVHSCVVFGVIIIVLVVVVTLAWISVGGFVGRRFRSFLLRGRFS